MKTEHQINALISKTLKKSGCFFYLKTSEKYISGVSDFLVWMDGRGLAMEVKLAKPVPEKSKRKLLSHPFSTEQISFLEGFHRIGGGISCGIVCIGGSKLYPIKWEEIPASGNWRSDEFLEKYGDVGFDISDIVNLMNFIYGK